MWYGLVIYLPLEKVAMMNLKKKKIETINIKILVHTVKLNIQLEKDQMAQRQLYISQV